MERDTEITNDSNIISKYYLRSKKGKENSKESIVKNFKIIILYIAIITTIIIIIKQNNLSKIKQKKELTDIVLNLKRIIYKHQQQLNQTNKIILRLYNKISVNSQYKIFTQKINQKYKEEQNFFCDNLNFLSNNEFENQIKKANVDFNKKIYDMYIFSDSDIVSGSIIKEKNWVRFFHFKNIGSFEFLYK
jgi:hypothetical protein